MDDRVLKKAFSTIRNQLEIAWDQEVEVIDVDAPSSTNFVDNTATPKNPSLWRAADETVLAAPVARHTLASDSPTPTGTSAEEVVPPTSPVKQKLSNAALIPLNEEAFQPSSILVGGDSTAATKKQAEYRALQTLKEAILRPSLTREQQVLEVFCFQVPKTVTFSRLRVGLKI